MNEISDLGIFLEMIGFVILMINSAKKSTVIDLHKVYKWRFFRSDLTFKIMKKVFNREYHGTVIKKSTWDKIFFPGIFIIIVGLVLQHSYFNP